MEYKIIYTQKAVDDFKQIAYYLKNHSASNGAAELLISKILDNINSLSVFPFSGAKAKSKALYRANYRFIVEGEYLIFYRVRENDVIIESVLHAKKDYYRYIIDVPKNES